MSSGVRQALPAPPWRRISLLLDTGHGCGADARRSPVAEPLNQLLLDVFWGVKKVSRNGAAQTVDPGHGRFGGSSKT